jgi:GTP-binding protein EngB required for normal cell division
MNDLSGPQRRHVIASFGEVERLLQAVERVARASPSPFAMERPDLSPDEARLLLSFVDLARNRMLAAMDRLAIPRPSPNVSARWSIETSLRFAEIALSELTPQSLAGYGTVALEASEELQALAEDLRGLIRRGAALLRGLDPEELRRRLADLPEPAGRVLRTLERLSREQGIPDTRSLISAAAERACATALEVGVFGRVGAGKSSLINALVGTPVMPVGATPVTAVPVVLGRGEAGATVSFYDGGARVVALEDLPLYVTEEHNPQNRRGVRAVEATVPTTPHGLRLLDTPGVGSLAESGPAQAFAWLPRCDLGVVLIQAGSPVGREELALVSGLVHAGIQCRILLSKVDLLSQAERERALAYVAGELNGAHGGVEPDVRVVSTRPEGLADLDAFRRDVLQPLARNHAQEWDRALRARLHRLVALTAAAIQGAPSSEAEPAAARMRISAAAAIEREAQRLAGAAPETLRVAARALAEAWVWGEDAAHAVRDALLSSSAGALKAVRSAAGGEIAGPLPSRSGLPRRLPPLFDPEFLNQLPPFAPPRIGRRLRGPAVATRQLRPLAAPLEQALGRYAERLRTWGLSLLDETATAELESAGTAPVALSGELAQIEALIDQPNAGP